MKTNNMIPLIQPALPPYEDFLQALETVWSSNWLTNQGPMVEKFELELEKYLKCPHVSVFTNGHIALEAVLRSLSLGEGEVITTPYTFISTTQAITSCSLTPVFCDIKESDCTIDENKIEALITEKTKAIVPVHVYGFPCNYKKIQEIADKYKLKVIYDAAHAFGGGVDGQSMTALGDASILSFHATKLFHTVEGGCVCYHDESLGKKLVAMRNFGFTEQGDVEEYGFNGKMGELHGAMGLCNLNTIDSIIQKRKMIIEYYLNALKNVTGISLFSWSNPDILYNYAYFPILFTSHCKNKRNQIEHSLKDDYGIITKRYFSPIISDFTRFKNEYNSNLTPIAKDISNRVLSLPLYPNLTYEEIDYICSSLVSLTKEEKEGCL